MSSVLILEKKGFTLVELMVVIGILGVLVATSIPFANAYRKKAQYLELRLTMKHIMDGLEVCYVENDEFYPPATEGSYPWLTGEKIVEKGEAAELTEIVYDFPAGHKHRYIFKRDYIDFSWVYGTFKYDYVEVTIESDLDYDGKNGPDIFKIYMCMLNNKPYGGWYRRVVPDYWE